MKKANKELLRLALEEYREACYRMQAESERCREIEAGEYDESKRPDPELDISNGWFGNHRGIGAV